MIGLGAKYLKAAGFGRYRITAVSLGRNLMFGSLGLLDDNAKIAIMAAFGVDGTAVIRATYKYLNGIAASDKAKATALAGFINEDPMMVCSLGLEPTLTTLPSMPIRVFDNNGTGYIDSGIIPNSTTEIELVYRYATKGGIVGSCQQYNTTDAMVVITYANSSQFGLYIAGANNIWYGSPQTNTWFKFNINVRGVTVKNLSTSATATANTGKTTLATSSRSMYIYTSNSANKDLAKLGDCDFQYCQIKQDGETHRFIPCKHKVNGVITTGMLDLWNNSYKPNAGSGQFTEEFGYMLNGSWVTWIPPIP
jgi:hypothetical protein